MITKEDIDGMRGEGFPDGGSAVTMDGPWVDYSWVNQYASVSGALDQMYDYYDPNYEEEFKQIMAQKTLEDFAKECHKASYDNGWWHDPDTGEELPTEGFLGAHVIGCKLGLIHSEVSEAMEGHRKSLKDDKLPKYDAIDVELVDALIRILDLMGKRKTPANDIYEEKMSFNDVRPDHALENRKKGGKLY